MLSNKGYKSQGVVSAQTQVDIQIPFACQIDLLKLRFFTWLNHWSANEISNLVGEEISEDSADWLCN